MIDVAIIWAASKVIHFSGVTSSTTRRGESIIFVNFFWSSSAPGMIAAERAGSTQPRVSRSSRMRTVPFAVIDLAGPRLVPTLDTMIETRGSRLMAAMRAR